LEVICNAFAELNDPMDQRQRFEDQLELGKRGDEEAMTLDADSLCALCHGIPPYTVGLGVGIDRLAMIVANVAPIRRLSLPHKLF
jgi:lysyl-tRNA synthetase, class II